MTATITLLLLTLFVCACSCGKGDGPSDTPISTTAPNLPFGSEAVENVPGPFFTGFNPPFPTNSWWQGFTLGSQNQTAAGPFPYQSRTTNTGLEFGHATNRFFIWPTFYVPADLELSVSFVGLPDSINNRKALAWDTQTVSLQYFNSISTMETYLVPGSPYMTFKFTNAMAVIKSLKGTINSFTWVTPGKKGLLKISNWNVSYLLYVVSGTPTLMFVQSGNTLTSTAVFTGTIRLVRLLNQSQETVLDAYSGTYATSMGMKYAVSGDVATQTWTWRVVGNAVNLLLLSWPHQRRVLQSPKYVNIEYMTVKGAMKGVTGNIWTQSYNLQKTTWFHSQQPHPSCLNELNKTLDYEVNALSVFIPGDFYRWGGRFAATSQLAIIAESIGRTDLIPKVLAVLKGSVEYFFDGSHIPRAAYETGWGGVINRDAPNSRLYNDHHFITGYFLRGAAVIGKYDPAWLTEHLDFFNHMARDIANPSPNDPYYTTARHMDFFAGHSWASGIGGGGSGRNQESSSEAINAYYSLHLFARATNNVKLIDWARLLLAIELIGTQEYWHLYPQLEGTPYPEPVVRDLITVGNVKDTEVGVWLHFGVQGAWQRIQVAGINILPLTPISDATCDPEWVKNVVPYCQGEIDELTITDEFKSVIVGCYATFDPKLAYSYSSELSIWGTGNTPTNQLYFVASKPSATEICSSSRPEGNFLILDFASKKYVGTITGDILSTKTASAVLATPFELTFIPGGGTIKSLFSDFYASGHPNGTSPIVVNRKSPFYSTSLPSYETFRWKDIGAGKYELNALVNRSIAKVQTDGSGNLINKGVASQYQLVPTPAAAVPAFGKLRNVNTRKYVKSTASATNLVAGEDLKENGSVFRFEKVNDAVYVIWQNVTGKAVTANPNGLNRLAATATKAQSWEKFRIVQDQGTLVLVHTQNSLAVAVQADNTLLNNDATVGDGAHWLIE